MIIYKINKIELALIKESAFDCNIQGKISHINDIKCVEYKDKYYDYNHFLFIHLIKL